MKKLPAILGIASLFAGAAGAAIMIYLWIELGRRGEIADSTQTAGYTTNGEIAAGVLGLGLTGLGIVGFIVTAVLLGRRSDGHHR